MVIVLIADTKFEFALLGPEHDRLAIQPAHHVEGRLGFAAQGQFEQVFLDAGFDGLAQFRLDLKEAIRRTHAFNALVGPLVVVILDPEFDAFLGCLEAVELGAHQELLPDRGPEAFHLAEGHGMLRPGLEVLHAILLQHGLETAGAAPTGVLAAIVGQHLLGWLILADGHAINFNHGLGGGAAEQTRPHDEPRVIIHEGDQVGVTATQPEGEDVRLPHLVGGGPLEEPGPDHVPPFGGRGFGHQFRLMQALPHRLGAGRQEEAPAQHLADAFDAKGRVRLFEFDDLVGDGRRQLGPSWPRRAILQTGFARQPIGLQPFIQAAIAGPHLLADQRSAEPFFQI